MMRWKILPACSCVALAVWTLACPKDTAHDAGVPAQPTWDAGVLGPLGGKCVSPCQTAGDCCTGPQCNSGIFHYACEGGACRQVGCVGDGDCSWAPGDQCAVLGTFGVCAKGCTAPQDCCPPVPPGVVFPDGLNALTVAFDGGQATFYRCGAYPQRYVCAGALANPVDGGASGVCLRACGEDLDCPGIVLPVDGGFMTVRVDGGRLEIPTAQGLMRLFEQRCVPIFPGAGSCQKGCLLDEDCCLDATGAACQSLGARQVCMGGVCVKDGCRTQSECGTGMCVAQ